MQVLIAVTLVTDFFSLRYVWYDNGEINNVEEIKAWRQRDVDAKTYIYSTIKLEQQASLHGTKCGLGFKLNMLK